MKSIVLTLVVGVALAGCDAVPLGAEAKINAAVPVAPEILAGRAAMLEAFSGARQKAFENEWTRRMTLRALTCAKGYSPSWFTTVSAAREKLTDRACFQEQDVDLGKWVGYQRIGILLAQPALRPIPATPPKLIGGEDQIQSVTVASEAGVALLASRNGTMQLVDLGSGQALRRDKLPDGNLGQLSPNGRLLLVGDKSYSHLKVLATESGEEVARIPKTREWRFQWMGTETALYSRDGEYKAVLVDFATGKESELPIGEVKRVFRVPGEDRQFIVGTERSIVKAALVRNDDTTGLDVIEERRYEGRSWTRNLTDQTADGARIFNVDQSSIVVTDPETLAQEKIDFGPGAFLHEPIVTADPDKLLLRTNAPATSPGAAVQARDYLYSFTDKTLAPLQEPRTGSAFFVRPIKAILTVSGARLEHFEPVVGTDSPLAVEQLAAERQLREAERRLAEADRQLNWGAIPGAQPAPGAMRGMMPTAPLASLAADASIEGVGVYQGSNVVARQRRERSPGVVEVKVRRSAKPVILVLAAYEPVRWIVNQEPGARVSAVLLSGYHPSTVVGTSARVVTLGQKYAYQSGGREYQELDGEVLRMTGRRIGLFQGRYEGGSFSIGGAF